MDLLAELSNCHRVMAGVQRALSRIAQRSDLAASRKRLLVTYQEELIYANRCCAELRYADLRAWILQPGDFTPFTGKVWNTSDGQLVYGRTKRAAQQLVKRLSKELSAVAGETQVCSLCGCVANHTILESDFLATSL